jgi:adenylylsulfate kinase-like enzyme
MYEGEANRVHPKINRLLQFEKEKKENEKPIIVASTHIRLPLTDREKAAHISKELTDFLVQHNVSFITAHHLYGLWQKAKRGEIDIFAFFQKIYSHRGDISPQKRNLDFLSPSPDLPIQ